MDIAREIEQAGEKLATDVEELFPPKPGGLIDRHRKKKAAEEAAGETSATTELGRNKVKAVRTVVEAADIANATTVLLNLSQPVQRLLPRDSHRRSAVILAVDNDVYVTSDPGMAINLAGSTTGVGAFYLPAGIGIPVESTAELWAAATTVATNSRVSVLINRESGAS